MEKHGEAADRSRLPFHLPRAPDLLFLVPLAYLGAVLLLQPTDRLGISDAAPWLGRLAYDDYDMTAMALRGLNASRGRLPGCPDPPPYLSRADFQRALDHDDELEPRYFLEYPHAAIVLFRLGFIGALNEPPPPPGLCDACHNNVVEHQPRGELEQSLWHRLRRAMRLYVVVMAGCLVLLILVLRSGYEASRRSAEAVWLLVLPGVLYFALNRFDVLPALLVALSLSCLGRGRPAASGALLGLATMVKVYPVLLAPLVLRYLSPDRRKVVTWSAAYGLILVVVFFTTLIAFGAEATLAPYRFQLTRPPEPWTLYGYVLPAGLAENGLAGSAVRNGTVALLLLALLWDRPASLNGVLRRGAIVLLAFVALQVFYSPQWILWLSPLLVPLAAAHRSVFRLAVALDLVTVLSFPVVFDWPEALGGAALRDLMIYARCAVLTGLVSALAYHEWPARSGNAGRS